MTNFQIRKAFSVFFFLAIMSLLSTNCHTAKNHDNGEHKTGEHTEKHKDSDSKKQGKDLKDYKVGEVLQLNMETYITIGSESLKMKIQEISEDSRCPLNVNCIQPGKAKIELMVIKELDMVSSVNLIAKGGGCQKMDGSCGNSTISQGYKFSLMGLTPYPGEDGKSSVSKEKYVAHVKVEALR